MATTDLRHDRRGGGGRRAGCARLHARLRATDPFTGEEFRIDDPDLLRWVHVTEVESFLTTARRAGLPLTDDEVDGYYTEQRRAAALVGLDPATVPGTAAEVADYYAASGRELRMTREAAETALFLTAPPLPWKLSLPVRLGLTLGPPRWAYLGIAGTALGAAAGLGPPDLRRPRPAHHRALGGPDRAGAAAGARRACPAATGRARCSRPPRSATRRAAADPTADAHRMPGDAGRA